MKYFFKYAATGALITVIFFIFMLGLCHVLDFIGAHLSKEVKEYVALSVIGLICGTPIVTCVGFLWIECLVYQRPQTAPEAPAPKKRARKKSNA